MHFSLDLYLIVSEHKRKLALRKLSLVHEIKLVTNCYNDNSSDHDKIKPNKDTRKDGVHVLVTTLKVVTLNTLRVEYIDNTSMPSNAKKVSCLQCN